MKLKLPERRRFVRLDVPIEVFFYRNGAKNKLLTKNISPVGFMVETPEVFEVGESLECELKVSQEAVPVKLRGKIIWQNRRSLEDGAPYDVGIDILKIEDDGKNEFLRYLCDLLYGSEYRERT